MRVARGRQAAGVQSMAATRITGLRLGEKYLSEREKGGGSGGGPYTVVSPLWHIPGAGECP